MFSWIFHQVRKGPISGLIESKKKTMVGSGMVPSASCLCEMDGCWSKYMLFNIHQIVNVPYLVVDEEEAVKGFGLGYRRVSGVGF